MEYMKPAINILFLMMIICVLPFLGGFAFASAVEDAVLGGHWEEVLDILGKDEKMLEDPIASMLMGHASLATNRNNESLLLFLLAGQDEKVLTLWSDWTESLLHVHPHNPVALYLGADAKARKGKWG